MLQLASCQNVGSLPAATGGGGAAGVAATGVVPFVGGGEPAEVSKEFF